MRVPWANLEGPARLLVISLTVLFVASGLCGLQFMADSATSGTLSSVFVLTGIIELLAIFVSAMLAIAALIAWPFSAVRSRMPVTHTSLQLSDDETQSDSKNAPHKDER